MIAMIAATLPAIKASEIRFMLGFMKLPLQLGSPQVIRIEWASTSAYGGPLRFCPMATTRDAGVPSKAAVAHGATLARSNPSPTARTPNHLNHLPPAFE